MPIETPTSSALTPTGKRFVVIGAFFGWLFAGVQMNTMQLASGPATHEFYVGGKLQPDASLAWKNLLDRVPPDSSQSIDKELLTLDLKKHNPRWWARYSSIFLFGAAFGGFVFGWLGDRVGRVRAMGASILFYSLFAGAGYFVTTPEQMLVLRFLSGMGMGGMWPTGVSLASEAWSGISRAALAGWLGASANFGIMLISAIAYFWPVEIGNWRWICLVAATPALLGVWVLCCVPESPQWLATRTQSPQNKSEAGHSSLLRMPLLKLTLIGIALGTIPTLGGWGVTQWLIRWAEAVSPTTVAPGAKAITALVRSAGGALGSLFGGWLASLLGRRTTYFLISLASLLLSEAIYLLMHPSMPAFPWAVFVVGAVSTVFFGWLPLYLPELFPTQARATGVGVSFNTGRILSAIGVLATGWLIAHFQEDYRQAGGIMSLVYALGMLVILFAPDTTGKRLSN
jgi:MFS family permease